MAQIILKFVDLKFCTLSFKENSSREGPLKFTSTTIFALTRIDKSNSIVDIKYADTEKRFKLVYRNSVKASLNPL